MPGKMKTKTILYCPACGNESLHFNSKQFKACNFPHCEKILCQRCDPTFNVKIERVDIPAVDFEDPPPYFPPIIETEPFSYTLCTEHLAKLLKSLRKEKS